MKWEVVQENENNPSPKKLIKIMQNHETTIIQIPVFLSILSNIIDEHSDVTEHFIT